MILTEELCTEIGEECCNGDPVYLNWYNSLGGWELWQFGCFHRETLDIESGTVFEKYFQDIATQNQRGVVLKKDAQITWTVGDEQIPLSYVSALQEIFYSPLVLLWQNGKYIRVNVDKDSVVVKNLHSQFVNFSFNIQLPKLFVCSN